MTDEELDILTARVIDRAKRLNNGDEQRQWEFNEGGIRAAIVLHIAVMQVVREIPIKAEN